MKKIFVAAGLSLAAVTAWAGCTFTTITIDGKTLNCSTCCVGQVCTTECS